jgi:hypothetical protein
MPPLSLPFGLGPRPVRPSSSRVGRRYCPLVPSRVLRSAHASQRTTRRPGTGLNPARLIPFDSTKPPAVHGYEPRLQSYMARKARQVSVSALERSSTPSVRIASASAPSITASPPARAARASRDLGSTRTSVCRRATAPGSSGSAGTWRGRRLRPTACSGAERRDEGGGAPRGARLARPSTAPRAEADGPCPRLALLEPPAYNHAWP